jgi:high-affinity iron transporter
MLVAFLIVLREGIEAALVVGIIASYLKQTGRQQWLPAIWVGIFLALAMVLLIGGALEYATAEFPQKQVELFEAVVGIVAVCILSSMVLWMKKVSKSIGGHLRSAVDNALDNKRNHALALIFMVFLAVAREGLETLFFLLALIQQSDSFSAPAGALLGIAASFVIGICLYRGSLRLNLSRFFQATSILIIFVSAGILANAFKALHEAGLWNAGQQIVFDWSEMLPADGPVGAVLAGVLGYQDTPTTSSLTAWAVYLIAALLLYFQPYRGVTKLPQNSQAS